MHVIATAGHVDHGKSTLVRALTGSEPDRLAEEHRRGLSIELGYCWTALPGVGDVAFVDVPGHERFIATMLSGIGPVPAVLFVVAADDPWMPQAAEHLAALDALGTAHGVVAVTRADLADPAPAMERARAELARTSLAGAPVLAVSARTGQGLDELRSLLGDLVHSLPPPTVGADVRLWVDRCFHIKGAGTVVTATLPAGTVRLGDQLALDTGARVRVRGLQSLEQQRDEVSGVARVALNLSGSDVRDVTRSSVLVSPDRWLFSTTVDVRIANRDHASRTPERPVLHIGATRVGCHVRPLGTDFARAGTDLARLTLERALPLRAGDRALLRDPGSRQVWGITVLDPAPPPLRRRGAAQARAAQLARHPGIPDLWFEVTTRGSVSRDVLARLGADPAHSADGVVAVGDSLMSAEWAAAQRSQRPLPDLPAAVEGALQRLCADLAEDPFAAPSADRLRELGIDPKSVTALARAGRLLHLGDGVVLLPGAVERAVSELLTLDQPFTTSQARQRLGTSRRVAIPLLAHLDRLGLTRRHPDDRRSVRASG